MYHQMLKYLEVLLTAYSTRKQT